MIGREKVFEIKQDNNEELPPLAERFEPYRAVLADLAFILPEDELDTDVRMIQTMAAEKDGVSEDELRKNYLALKMSEYVHFFQHPGRPGLKLEEGKEPYEIFRDISLIKSAESNFTRCMGDSLYTDKLGPDNDYNKQLYIYEELMFEASRRVNEENVELKSRLEEIEEFLECLNEKFETAEEFSRKDELTGLNNRRFFIKNVINTMQAYFGVVEKDRNNNERWKEVLMDESRDGKDNKTYLMMGDIAYLGLANDLIGHNNGNELLQKISAAANEIISGVCRLGGDELAAVRQVGDKTELEEIKRSVAETIPKMEGVADLKSHRLKPDLDIDFAHISEAIEVFRRLMHDDILKGGDEESKMRKEPLENNILRSFIEVWMMIADKRVYKTKAHKRILLLMKRSKANLTNYPQLLKGAYSITQGEVASFVEIEKGESADGLEKGTRLLPAIEAFCKEKERLTISAIDNPLKRRMAELVMEHNELSVV